MLRLRWLAAVLIFPLAAGGFAPLTAKADGTNTTTLLDLLIKKGIISSEEAEQVQAEVSAGHTNAPTTAQSDRFWKISPGIKNMELFGDIRVRYEDRTAHDPLGGAIDLKRFRYALRLGLRGEAFGSVYYGLRLETAANARSPWVTFGTATTSGTGQYQGPFGKSQAGIDLGQIYLGWRPTDWLDVTIGKMPQPMYTTPMLWDTDINPEGLAEHFKYTVGEADFFANFGQFYYQDTNPSRATTGYFNNTFNDSNPVFLMAWQAGLEYHITKRMTFKVAPALYNYTAFGENPGNGTSITPAFNGDYVGQGSTNGVGGSVGGYNLSTTSASFDGFAANQTGIAHLLVLEIPYELNYRFDHLNWRIFGDYAENLNGSDRAEAAYQASLSPVLANSGIIPIPSAQTQDTKAYQVGMAIGSTNTLGLVYGQVSRKHAWEVRGYWQHVEQYSLDPNLIDSDFFEGRENLEGFYTSVAYGLTDNVIATARYGYAHRINDKLGTGGSNQDIPQMNPISTYNIFQVDLTMRF